MKRSWVSLIVILSEISIGEDGTCLDVIGLDEISLKKGHRDFVAIITGRIETETIIVGVLPDRTKATVKAFLSGIPQRVRHTILLRMCRYV